MGDGAVSGDERPGVTVGRGSCRGGGKAHWRQGSEGVETPVLESSKLVERVSASGEMASVTEGCDQVTAASLS